MFAAETEAAEEAEEEAERERVDAEEFKAETAFEFENDPFGPQVLGPDDFAAIEAEPIKKRVAVLAPVGAGAPASNVSADAPRRRMRVE